MKLNACENFRDARPPGVIYVLLKAFHILPGLEEVRTPAHGPLKFMVAPLPSTAYVILVNGIFSLLNSPLQRGGFPSSPLGAEEN